MYKYTLIHIYERRIVLCTVIYIYIYHGISISLNKICIYSCNLSFLVCSGKSTYMVSLSQSNLRWPNLQDRSNDLNKERKGCWVCRMEK